MKNEVMGCIERTQEVKGKNGRVDRMCYYRDYYDREFIIFWMDRQKQIE